MHISSPRDKAQSIHGERHAMSARSCSNILLKRVMAPSPDAGSPSFCLNHRRYLLILLFSGDASGCLQQDAGDIVVKREFPLKPSKQQFHEEQAKEFAPRSPQRSLHYKSIDRQGFGEVEIDSATERQGKQGGAGMQRCANGRTKVLLRLFSHWRR